MTQNGKKVANVRLAVNKKKGDQQTTTWFPVIAWEQRADVLEDYVNKGDMLAVHGEIASREWTDSDGAKRIVFEVTASDVELITPKEKSSVPNVKTHAESREHEYEDVPF